MLRNTTTQPLDANINKLAELIDEVRAEQPDSSGHNFVNSYYDIASEDGTVKIVRPGNIDVAEFNAAHSSSAKLAAVMSPEMAAYFVALLRSLDNEDFISSETQKVIDHIKWKLSFKL